MGTVRQLRDHQDLEHREVLYAPRFETDVVDEPTTEPGDDRVTRMVVASGSSFELFTGLVGLVLAIVGLAGYAPIVMASIATIAVGFSLLVQGITVAMRWHEAVRIAGSERTDAMGIGTEIFGGFAAVVLGFVALFGLLPMTVLPAAALVLGVALLLGGPAQPDIAELAQAPESSDRRWHVSRSAVRTSSGVMVMGGLAAIVLGVLASAGLAPAIPLSLIALLCVGAALMLAGGTLLARFTHRFA